MKKMLTWPNTTKRLPSVRNTFLESQIKTPKAYSEPCQTCKMDGLGKIVNNLKPVTIFAISSILDV